MIENKHKPATELTNAEFKDLQDFIYKKSGMFFPLSRKHYIEQKVLKRIQTLRSNNFKDYFNILKNELIRTEIITLFNEITVNETFFFRDLPQLEVLETHILPEALARGKKTVNILSAGCSSGEEPYTISIILREKFPYLSYNIWGIDISDLVVANASRAEYSEYAVRFIPKQYLKKYFAQLESGDYKFQDEYKSNIKFKKFNLMEFDSIPFNVSFDVIFCRYVLIYFDRDSKQKVIDSFYAKMAPGGYLILGNSESLFPISNAFRMLHYPSAIIYNRNLKTGEIKMTTFMEQAREVVAKIGELPHIPRVILESMKLLNDPSSTVKEIQEQILLDQALTVFILKVANSALYGLRKEVSTVTYAINLMGYNVTRSILTAYLSKNLYTGKGKRLIQTMLWKHAISTAVYGRKIAEHLNNINPEEAFISSLLHDIGKGVLLKNKTQQFEDIVQLIYNENQSSLEAERNILEYTHIDVGYLLMKNWRFSDQIVETVIYHHNVSEYTGDNLLVPIVSLANKLSHLNDYTFDKREEELNELQVLKISDADLDKIQHQANKEIEKFLEIF